MKTKAYSFTTKDESDEEIMVIAAPKANGEVELSLSIGCDGFNAVLNSKAVDSLIENLKKAKKDSMKM